MGLRHLGELAQCLGARESGHGNQISKPLLRHIKNPSGVRTTRAMERQGSVSCSPLLSITRWIWQDLPPTSLWSEQSAAV